LICLQIVSQIAEPIYIKSKKISLKPGQINDKYRDFSYTAEIDMIFNDGKSNQVVKEEGTISVVEEGGEWKVDFIKVTSFDLI
jgi:hypothetical protein